MWYKLKYIEGKDFFSFESFSVKFTRGMTLITGYDEGGKDSNGSGKSTILNAISWALFGRTLKGVSGMDVVRWGCKNCKVVLILEGQGNTYEITRSLDKLHFTINGDTIHGHHRDVQTAIDNSFKTDYALFIRSTAFSQGQVEFLAASGDSDKKKIFKEVLSLSKLDLAYEKIRVRYETHFRIAERLEGSIEADSHRKKVLEDKITQIQDSLNSWEEERANHIQQLQDKKRKTPQPLEPVQAEIKILQRQLEEFKDLGTDIADTENKLIQLSIEESQYSKEVERLWKIIEKGQDIGTRCELCGSVVNKKMIGAHMREVEEQITNLKTQRDSIIKEKTDTHDYVKYLYSIRLQREEAEKELQNRQGLVALRLLEWEHYHVSCKDIDIQIDGIIHGENPYTILNTDLSNELRVISASLEVDKKAFEIATKLIDTLAFLKFTLSREGAINHIIEREYSSLVSYSNRMLYEISGGKLRLSISPMRELKSGALKDEIDISVFVNDRKTTYWGLSDGQRQRVNIALLLALNKLCKVKGVNSFDFLLLDEVLDISLAEGGQQDVLFLLRNYLRECSSIILISHQESFKASFTSCLSVYRDFDGISHLAR